MYRGAVCGNNCFSTAVPVIYHLSNRVGRNSCKSSHSSATSFYLQWPPPLLFFTPVCLPQSSNSHFSLSSPNSTPPLPVSCVDALKDFYVDTQVYLCKKALTPYQSLVHGWRTFCGLSLNGLVLQEGTENPAFTIYYHNTFLSIFSLFCTAHFKFLVVLLFLPLTPYHPALKDP